MIAIEFQTSVKNGIIEIPEEYRDQVAGAVRVIVLRQPPKDQEGILARLLKNPIQDPSFKPLTRDEIYQDRP
ncbi:MAG TPA: hypothetical protein PKE64_12385 [Anaerolineae bacterium]|nr:hypothetical protein [Anaerolineae bacterium]HMR64797.1 hypothetical protein [Anaerolineae bacterium]